MAIAKTPVVVRFGKLDQLHSSKTSVLGTLEQAINVRQRKIGRYSKRYGYGVTDRTCDSGSITDSVALGSNDGAPLLQTSSAVFLRDSANSTWRNKGSLQTVMPGTRDLAFANAGSFPTHCVSGTQLYSFSNDRVTGRIYYRITDTTTGAELVAATALDTDAYSSGTIEYTYGRPIVLGANVWFVYLKWDNPSYRIRLAKFVVATPAVAPTYTTLLSENSGDPSLPDIRSMDAFLPTGGSYPAVIYSGHQINGTGGNCFCFYIDPATAAVKASPGIVAVGSNAGSGYAYWLRDSVNSTDLWAAGVSSGTALNLYQITASTLATSATTVLEAVVGTSAASMCGYVNGTTKVVFYCDNSTAANVETSVTTRYNRTSTTTTSTVFCRGQFPVSQPFLYNSNWYVITSHDDVIPATSVAANLQRAYYLRDASSTTYTNILARALYGLGGDIGMRGAIASGITMTQNRTGFCTEVSSSGTTITSFLNGNVGGDLDFATYRTTWEFASLGSRLDNVTESQTIFPGGWPRQVTGGATVNEFTPAMFPRAVVGSVQAGGSMTVGVYQFSVCYLITDASGNFYRSAPAASDAFTLASTDRTARIVYPTLRTLDSNATAKVEMYLTTPGGSVPFLVKVNANDPTVDTVTVNFTSNPTFGEALYTGGGVLSNYPAPPFRSSFTWNDRYWLLGTEDEGEAWHSKQFATGIGPEFAPPLKVTCYGGTGSLRAGGVVSSDYAALFKRDAVFAVTGQGPDDTGGGGSFQVRRISWDGGCTNHASVVAYPGGLLFQGLDGIIYRLNSGLAVDDIGAEALNYASGTVSRAMNFPKAREVRFWLSTGKILVLDYGNANENAPDGYWYLDSSDTFGAASGAIVVNDLAQFVDSSGVVWKEVASQYYDGTSTAILQKLDINTISPFDLGIDGRLSRLRFLGAYHSTHDIRISVAVDGGSDVTYDKTGVSSSPEDFDVRPGGCGRVSALDITVEETGTNTGRAFSFDGVLLEVQPRGRGQRVNSGQRI